MEVIGDECKGCGVFLGIKARLKEVENQVWFYGVEMIDSGPVAVVEDKGKKLVPIIFADQLAKRSCGVCGGFSPLGPEEVEVTVTRGRFLDLNIQIGLRDSLGV